MSPQSLSLLSGVIQVIYVHEISALQRGRLYSAFPKPCGEPRDTDQPLLGLEGCNVVHLGNRI